jgi:hypothetical protein
LDRAVGRAYICKAVPSTAVAAGASTVATGPAFAEAVGAITMRLQRRGSFAVCAAGCACDYLTECGVRYDGLPRGQTSGCFGGL